MRSRVKVKKADRLMMGEVFWQVVAIAIAGTPTWFWLLVKSLMEPEGFWQNLVVYGVGFYFLGGIQLVLLIGLIAFSIIIWSE